MEMAIKKRWLTEDSKKLAMQAIKDGLQSDDARVKQAAVRNLIAMEAQNQKDEREMDRGRNRILDLLARARTATGPESTDTGRIGIVEHGDGIALQITSQPGQECESEPR